jgi:hypothetical protein
MSAQAASQRSTIERRPSGDRFLSTLPGILTGLAGLLTAVGTIIGVLYGTHAIGGASAKTQHGLTVTYPYRPAEGVATRAVIATRKNGPAVLTVPEPVKQLWVTFTLAVQPASRLVTVSWYRPNGSIDRLQKPAGGSVTSFVSSARPLAPGRWHAVLSANGLVIKDVAIRITRASLINSQAVHLGATVYHGNRRYQPSSGIEFGTP